MFGSALANLAYDIKCNKCDWKGTGEAGAIQHATVTEHGPRSCGIAQCVIPWLICVFALLQFAARVYLIVDCFINLAHHLEAVYVALIFPTIKAFDYPRHTPVTPYVAFDALEQWNKACRLHAPMKHILSLVTIARNNYLVRMPWEGLSSTRANFMPDDP